MVSGVARQKLEGEGYHIAAAIPTVVSGENHCILHVMAGPSIIIPFETADGPFVVDICLKEP
jgi:chemotaxis protein CheX